jgi:glyoxylase-like metal-dependent hydrolase (beta-lactamase superfamily II)
METQIGFIAPLKSLIKAKHISYKEIRENDNYNLKIKDSRKFLASLGIAGEIIATPGHSEDSVTLILDEGSAFTGDLPPRFLVSDDDTITHESWEKISRHKINRIFPAHGG